MRFALALIAALFVQDSVTKENFHFFEKDTKWTYEFHNGKKKYEVDLKVINQEKGRSMIESKEYQDGRSVPATLYEQSFWAIKDGLLQWSAIKKGEEKVLYHPYKPGSRKGDTWDAAPKDVEHEEGVEFTFTATHQGEAEVTVPAGTYQKAAHVSMKMEVKYDGKEIKTDFNLYFVHDVGLVKLEIKEQNGTLRTMRLKTFSMPGK